MTNLGTMWPAKRVRGPESKAGPRAWSRELLIEAVRLYAEVHGGPVRQCDFLRATGIGRKQVASYFVGGWRELVAEAGAEGAAWGQREKFSEDELLAALGRFHEAQGRWPTWREFAEATGAGKSTLQGRFGSKGELVRRYHEWRAERESE